MPRQKSSDIQHNLQCILRVTQQQWASQPAQGCRAVIQTQPKNMTQRYVIRSRFTAAKMFSLC